MGESVQYFMPSSGLAEFSGVEGDVHLPKPGKATPQLAEAIRHARTSVGVYYDPISKVYKKGGRGAPEPWRRPRRRRRRRKAVAGPEADDQGDPRELGPGAEVRKFRDSLAFGTPQSVALRGGFLRAQKSGLFRGGRAHPANAGRMAETQGSKCASLPSASQSSASTKPRNGLRAGRSPRGQEKTCADLAPHADAFPAFRLSSCPRGSEHLIVLSAPFFVQCRPHHVSHIMWWESDFSHRRNDDAAALFLAHRLGRPLARSYHLMM